ncbi:MAG: circadian clock protein KaiC [Armatimonadota bacterium]
MSEHLVVPLEKAPTGITGLDEITNGGLPKGRPTLVAGGPGCGKTMLAMEFLVRGATQFGEPGVFMTFEEKREDLVKNFASMGMDLEQLAAEKKIAIDYVYVERSEIEETGEYDLEGLFVRLGLAVDSIGAKRVVLDTIESLFSGFGSESILRAELRRLFRWLKDRGLTAVITGEQGQGQLTRQGLEEYVSDCVIFLDHRVKGQITTRRLRVVKYRGSGHGTNEYPFIIGDRGISVLPITSLGLQHEASTERVSTGVSQLDEMMGGGYYRGSSILISGTAGTGKSSLAAHFVAKACGEGRRSLYFAFEESQSQIIRNMGSIGLDMQPCMDSGNLKFNANRATFFGLESHLLMVHDAVREFKPDVVVFDPITNLINAGDPAEVKAMLTRIIDFLKVSQITALFTSLTSGREMEETQVGVSSLMDTWIMLTDIDLDGERNRSIQVLKSRGMAHSNQVREFLLTGEGIKLVDVYVGPGKVLTGSARVNQEAIDETEKQLRQQDIESHRRELERKQALVDARIAALQAEFETEKEEVNRMLARAAKTQARSAEGESEVRQRREANISQE